MTNVQAPSTQGSVGLGFLAGLFGGCLGAGFVYVLAKGPDTKKGALYGLLAQMCIGFVFGFAFTTKLLK
ncbi:hypothetical protein LZC95_37875 [Pendulispora brunnea]|uniref:Uncharacterized protein n=1 Tax=Pendulispora brunnea TaxID=2905690 RepID=A0ABZ2K4R5_9BACT